MKRKLALVILMFFSCGQVTPAIGSWVTVPFVWMWKHPKTTICLGGLVLIVWYKIDKTKRNMSSQKSSPWLTRLNEITAARSSGSFAATDKQGKPIVLEWKKLTTQSPDFSKTMQSFCDITCAGITPIKVQFLKAFSDPKVHEEYCKVFDYLFKNDPLEKEWLKFRHAVAVHDWQTVEALMPMVIKQTYTIDYSASACGKIGNPADLHFFVMAKDGETKTLLGFIEFLITPKYPFGDIGSNACIVDPVVQNRGLGKLLRSSILKIVPNECKRLFLSTRITNKVARRAFAAWGFTTDRNPIQEPDIEQNPEHWVFLEYNVEQCSKLQDAAKQLQERI